MAQIIRGNRVAKTGQVQVGCAAVIFDAPRQRVLLTRRADNGLWCLPGGALEPGESVTETCVREVFEETGLLVQVSRFIGVYSDPDRLRVYPDGTAFHLIGLCFEAHHLGGDLQLSDETTAYGFFSWEEMSEMDLLDQHRERIVDAFANQASACIR